MTVCETQWPQVFVTIQRPEEESQLGYRLIDETARLVRFIARPYKCLHMQI